MASEDQRHGPAQRAGGIEIRPDTRVLVVAAHPDDDVLAAGGLLRRALSRGGEVAVAFATDGENNPWAQRASERRLIVTAADRPRFGAGRRAEALAGLSGIGVPAGRVRFLGLPDQGLTGILLADPGPAVASLRAVVADARPTLLLGPAAADLHPDHSALAVLLRLALAGLPGDTAPAELAYVVHNPALRHADAPAATIALSDAERAAKLAAILCHATQLHLRGPWLRSFASATEAFLPVPTTAPHPVAFRGGAGGALEIAVTTRPRARAFGARTLLVLADHGDDRPRALACPLPARSRRVAVRDAASGAPLGAARYAGHARAGTLLLPAALVAGAVRLFLKLERRVGFFDEAGWAEIRHEARGASRRSRRIRDGRSATAVEGAGACVPRRRRCDTIVPRMAPPHARAPSRPPELRGRSGFVRERLPKPRRRFRAGRLLAALHRASETLQVVIEPDVAAWAALVTLTAGEGFAFNRAFILLRDGDELRGRFGIGPQTREEAARVWAELRRDDAHPLEALAELEPGEIEREQAKHVVLLARLSHPLVAGCGEWRRPFVARGQHPNPCVHHWVTTLDSSALAVIPMAASGHPWGVLLADNFVTGAPIYPGTLEAAATLANALRVALERTHLMNRLKEEEKRRIASEHATALVEAARALAHDLKNPLALAGGLARELLAGDPAEAAAGRRDLETIAGAVRTAEERLAQLVDGLASRLAGVSLEVTDVGAVVERVVNSIRPLAGARRIHLVCYRPQRAVRALAEPSFLERCVENLVGNALQSLREAQATSGVVRVAVLQEEDAVRVEVADNGPPLPTPLRSDPFAGGVSTRARGTGLGLVSVRRLTDAMGGRVEYDEREPGWVRFSLLLRRAD